MSKNLGTINLLSGIVASNTLNGRWVNGKSNILLNRFNTVVAWNLAKAFEKQGYKSNLVYTYKPVSRRTFSWRELNPKIKAKSSKTPPKADHTIAISGISMVLLRGAITKKLSKHYWSSASPEDCERYRRVIEEATS